ncbi:MAG TPA: sulfotransferase [Rudaea sp.]|nr:sulfotransferase [Rudaea sp.]
MILSQQQRLAGLSPDLARRAVDIGKALRERRVDDAERGAIAAFALAPKHAEILYLFGRVQSLRGRHEQAVDSFLHAQAVRPNDALIWIYLGAALEELKDFDRARKAFRKACEVGPEYPSAWFNLGRRLIQDGFSEEALPVLRRAVEVEPRHAGARTMLANVLRSDGRDAEAETEYRAVVDEKMAGASAAWWGLAMLKPMPLNDIDIAEMQRRLREGGMTDSDQAMTRFALAIAFEHRGDYAPAFEQMQTAHALMRKFELYDGDYFTNLWSTILDAFPGGGAESSVAQGDEVIFIVSLPRSGSTLTEQILASHSLVEGGTELPDLSQVIMDESDRVRQSFLLWAKTHTPEQWRKLGQEYLKRTARWRKTRPKSTDKAPSNWQYVGAILSMLPNAKIVVARRDPLETCLGCYRYMVARHPYVHDFNDLARHWHDFDHAIAHWKKAYPGRVREQIYENLIADPETQIRELLDFCDLPFEEACLNFHETERRVSTPSASQVREPLRKDTARSSKYGALLDPLRAALGMPPFNPS